MTAVTTDAPLPLGPYGQGIVSPPFVFVSGCLGMDPKTGNLVEGGVEAQTRQALQNVKGIVEAGGSQVGRILVKTTVRSPESGCTSSSARHLTHDDAVYYY